LVALGAKFVPDILQGQWWRFFTAIFLHVGVIHFVMNMLFQLRVARSLEISYGAFRIAPIYLLCGVFGNLISAIFLPTTVEVGASGALFGFLGVLLSDLIQNWNLLQSPVKNLISLIVTIVIALAIGLLPGVDNFCHIGGFIMGIITGFIFLPNLSYGKCQARWRTCVVCTFIPLMIIMFLTGFIIFYLGIDNKDWCGWCQYLACVPIVKSWCANTVGGN